MQTVRTKRPRGSTISKLSVAPTWARPGPTSFRVVADGGGRGEGGQVFLEGDDEGCYAEDPDPGGEEAEDRYADRLRYHATAYLERRDGARVDHPEHVLEDRAEDDEDADDLDAARRRAGASRRRT